MRNFRQLFKNCTSVQKPVHTPLELILNEKKDMSSFKKKSVLNFLPLDQPKMRFRCDRESDVSSGRQALRTHFLPIDLPKMQLG